MLMENKQQQEKKEKEKKTRPETRKTDPILRVGSDFRETTPIYFGPGFWSQ